MIVDISPDSPYYVTRNANIAWHDSSVYDNNTYEIGLTVNNQFDTADWFVVVDLTSLMTDMANPVIIASLGTNIDPLPGNDDNASGRIMFFDENDQRIAYNALNQYVNLGGGIVRFRTFPIAVANLAAYKTLKTKILMHLAAWSAGAHDVTISLFMSGYISLYDAKC